MKPIGTHHRHLPLRHTYSHNRYQPFTTSHTTSTAMHQYLVIAMDQTDGQALQRRLAARQTHLVGATAAHAAKQLLIGGAILSSDPATTAANSNPTMVGSALIFQAESEAQVREWIEADPYVRKDVWGDIKIFPFKVAVP
ncbi:hypothetical protein H4R35_005247 [Dimargaris xerosporica]|nr:hypothetical protein H4R35_005247 [Dimargaris xerosporica]